MTIERMKNCKVQKQKANKGFDKTWTCGKKEKKTPKSTIWRFLDTLLSLLLTKCDTETRTTAKSKFQIYIYIYDDIYRLCTSDGSAWNQQIWLCAGLIQCKCSTTLFNARLWLFTSKQAMKKHRGLVGVLVVFCGFFSRSFCARWPWWPWWPVMVVAGGGGWWWLKVVVAAGGSGWQRVAAGGGRWQRVAAGGLWW